MNRYVLCNCKDIVRNEFLQGDAVSVITSKKTVTQPLEIEKETSINVAPGKRNSETTRKISNLLSELVGDHPAGENARPDLVPMR